MLSPSTKSLFLIFIAVCALMWVRPADVLSQQGVTGVLEAQGYRVPPKGLADIVDADPTPSVRVGPHKKWLLLLESPNLPSIVEVAQPELRLAGLRINPRTHGPATTRYYKKLSLQRIADKEEVSVDLPEDVRIRNISWSPDGSAIAFTLNKEDGIELWFVDVATGAVKKLLGACLNNVQGTVFTWLPDSSGLICKVVPDDLGEPPEAPLVPSGPVIQENMGRKAPARTFQDLLAGPHDEAVFEYYMTSEIKIVKLDGGIRPISPQDMFTRISPSPDGKLLFVETMHRPYSYLVPYYRFPKRIEIWDMKGNRVHVVADLPLAEEVPQGFGSTTTGPRSFTWRADAPATLCWVEARDGGDPKKPAEVRDELFMQPAPFDKKPISLIKLALRYSGVTWGNGDTALVSSSWWKTRKTRTWRIRPDHPETEKELIVDRSYEDRYADPGRPVTHKTKAGRSVLLFADDDETLFLIGRGASPEGNRPFLDRFNLKTKATERLFRSEAPYYESIVALLDDTGSQLITRRESTTEVPNYYLRDLTESTLEPLTAFPHPFPELKDIQKELIHYERDDGVKLTGTLFLPPGYSPEKDGPLPVLMWAYPQEYKSADAAGQVRSSPHQFIRISAYSPSVWVTQGYAVLSGPGMPIIGEGDAEPNDTFVPQLVANAQAAIDELVRRGVGDKTRMAIGGHSYGAFMTAHLLIWSDLFCTGIARSGAYNRTLTPFGFQSEERTFWEAPEIYFKMSPFTNAHKINEPILMIHGQADSNSGTFPMQSERLYHALKGLGGTARLIMLPEESHSYRARESVMHMLWEMSVWMDKHLKKPSN